MPFDLDRLLSKQFIDSSGKSDRQRRREQRLPRLGLPSHARNSPAEEEEAEEESKEAALERVRDSLEVAVLRHHTAELRQLLPQLYSLGGSIASNDHKALCKGLALHRTSLLHLAAEAGFGAGLELMLQFDQDAAVDHCDAAQFTALHRAAEEGQPRAVEVLLRHGACPFARTRQKNLTPLHIAVQQANAGVGPHGEGYLAVVHLLLARSGQPPEDGSGRNVHLMAATPTMRLAIAQTPWSPRNHRQFPSGFKAAVRVLILAASLPPHDPYDEEGEEAGEGVGFHHLSRDVLYIIIGMAAHPLGAWVGLPRACSAARGGQAGASGLPSPSWGPSQALTRAPPVPVREELARGMPHLSTTHGAAKTSSSAASGSLPPLFPPLCKY